MINKKIILFLLISFLSILYAHQIPGISVETTKLENDKINIKAFFKRSKKPLIENEVRLISMFDKRVLKKGKLSYQGVVLEIPKESYWIYVIVRDNDIVAEGLPPKKGFNKTIEKTEIAILYTLGVCIFFIFLSFFIGYKKSKRSDEIIELS